MRERASDRLLWLSYQDGHAAPLRIRWAARLAPARLASSTSSTRAASTTPSSATRWAPRCSRAARRSSACGAARSPAPPAAPCSRSRARERAHVPAEPATWQTDHASYWESIQNHYAFTGRAREAYAAFHARYPLARSYGEKIVLIDQLIHAFHLSEQAEPVKSVASKLLEGNKKEVVRFLDRLSARDPQAKEEWRRIVATTIDAARAQARGAVTRRRLAAIGALAAVAASAGDLLMLWVANARRPELGLAAPPDTVLWLGAALGVVGHSRVRGGLSGGRAARRGPPARSARGVRGRRSARGSRCRHPRSDRAADRGRPPLRTRRARRRSRRSPRAARS